MIAAEPRFAVGVGSSVEADSFAAGAAAAAKALSTGGGLVRCDLVLVFSTSKHDPARLRDGIRSVVGAGPRIAGGYAVGIITNDALSYGGYEVGVAAFASSAYRFGVFVAAGLAGREREVGRELGALLTADGVTPSDALLLFYDSIDRSTGRMRLNMATPLLAGLAETAPHLQRFVGAGFCGDMRSQATYQWIDDGILQQAALVLTIAGGLTMHTRVVHGCAPASSYRTITASDGPAILAIDGKPALEAIAEMIGNDVPHDDYGFFVTLGVNHGDKWGAYDPDKYTNRLCLRVDEKRGALIMFEPDLVPGTEVQLMHRSIDLAYIGTTVAALRAEISAAGRTARFALYIDCAGRAAAYSGSDEEEAAEVQRLLPDVPLLGFYSGVEIGPIDGTARPLDWTGVLCLFCE